MSRGELAQPESAPGSEPGGLHGGACRRHPGAATPVAERNCGRAAGSFALFVGPSGAGRTTAAERLASERHLNLYPFDLSAVMSKCVGETEKNPQRIFADAERAGAMLFIDPADALLGKRTDLKDGHDRESNVDADSLLARMEAHRGLDVLATNTREQTDGAFRRRIRHVVPFTRPVEGRR